MVDPRSCGEAENAVANASVLGNPRLGAFPTGAGSKVMDCLGGQGRDIASSKVATEHFARRSWSRGRTNETKATDEFGLVHKAISRPSPEKSDGYDLTSYSASFTVFMPDLCPVVADHWDNYSFGRRQRLRNWQSSLFVLAPVFCILRWDSSMRLRIGTTRCHSLLVD